MPSFLCVLGLVLCLAVVLGVVSVARSQASVLVDSTGDATAEVPERKLSFGIMLDAGSSGTRSYIFSWDNGKYLMLKLLAMVQTTSDINS